MAKENLKQGEAMESLCSLLIGRLEAEKSRLFNLWLALNDAGV